MILDLDRAVYVTGFLGTESSMNGVCDGLEKIGYTNVETIKFSEARKDPSKLARMIKGSEVWMHSAATVPVGEVLYKWGARPSSLNAIAAPVPTSRRGLLVGALRKTIDTERYIRSVGGVESDLPEVIREAVHEPKANFWPLINGEISRSSGVDLTVDAQQMGIQASLGIMSRDGFRFHPDTLQRQRAIDDGVVIKDIAGLHDHLPIFPIETIDEYIAVPAAIA